MQDKAFYRDAFLQSDLARLENPLHHHEAGPERHLKRARCERQLEQVAQVFVAQIPSHIERVPHHDNNQELQTSGLALRTASAQPERRSVLAGGQRPRMAHRLHLSAARPAGSGKRPQHAPPALDMRRQGVRAILQRQEGGDRSGGGGGGAAHWGRAEARRASGCSTDYARIWPEQVTAPGCTHASQTRVPMRIPRAPPRAGIDPSTRAGGRGGFVVLVKMQ